jgi:hypothetical protein
VFLSVERVNTFRHQKKGRENMKVVTFSENKYGEGVIGRIAGKAAFIDYHSTSTAFPGETWMVDVTYEAPTYCFVQPIRQMIRWIWNSENVNLMFINGHPYLIKNPQDSGDWVTVLSAYDGDISCASPIEVTLFILEKKVLRETIFWAKFLEKLQEQVGSAFNGEEVKKTIRRNFKEIAERLDANEKIWETMIS